MGLVPQLLNLDLTHSQVRYAESLRSELRPDDRWLDLGCGHQIVPGWALPVAEQAAVAGGARLAIGVDVDPSIQRHEVLRLRAFANGYELPFRDGSFDLVTANMVVEHVAEPRRLLCEVRRVLSPGGRFVFHTPNRNHPAVRMASLVPDGVKRGLVRWLENRHAEDVFPTHYRLNSAGDISAAARAERFQVANIRSWSSVGVLSAVPVLSTIEMPILWLLDRDRFRDCRSNYLVQLIKA